LNTDLRMVAWTPKLPSATWVDGNWGVHAIVKKDIFAGMA